MFDLLVPILEKNRIENWTANEFWKHLKLNKKERNRFNRQRMYRLLRKLVEEGFLIKKINETNPKLSKFYETEKLNNFKNLSESSTDFVQMRESEQEAKKEICLLEKQLQNYELLERRYPNSRVLINIQKTKCKDRILDLNAYKTALNSVLASY